MKLLIITDSYPPEIRSSSHLMIELAEGLRDFGHAVTVLTCWPSYNLDKMARQRSFEASATEGGIYVIRVKTLPHHNVGFIKRGLAQLALPFQFLLGLRRYHNDKMDAVIVYSPPLPLAFVGEALRRRGVRYVLNVQDIFPQNAIDLGAMTNPILVRFFRWMERHAYSNADVVTAHSEGNRAQLAADNPESAGKLTILHNWVDSEQFAAGATEDFRKTYGLQGKFVIVYGGVIGPAQGLRGYSRYRRAASRSEGSGIPGGGRGARRTSPPRSCPAREPVKRCFQAVRLAGSLSFAAAFCGRRLPNAQREDEDSRRPRKAPWLHGGGPSGIRVPEQGKRCSCGDRRGEVRFLLYTRQDRRSGGCRPGGL